MGIETYKFKSEVQILLTFYLHIPGQLLHKVSLVKPSFMTCWTLGGRGFQQCLTI